MKRLISLLLKNGKRPCREFTFISYHSRVTEVQTDYRIKARSKQEASQMLKLYLQESRNNTRIFSHSVTTTPHRRGYQTAYCLKTDCMRDVSADKLVRQFYRVEGHPDPVIYPAPIWRWLGLEFLKHIFNYQNMV